ncbi:MAG TPA: class I SAM-dependent methyltransferase [Steroidobacteraceae bacterium]|jgi:SAM-dependent methyltransferase|nr:class I SAM-dependent methyltransferase [Steroidobacteraceae bacterium]
MQPSPISSPDTSDCSEPRLRDTQAAFDSVAADYDGPRGNNALIQDMREEMWRWLDATFAGPSRLIDIGCGTGLDAIRMARAGHRITATDWSPQMVQRTHDRALREQLQSRVQTMAVGAQQLARIDGSGSYDGAYSNLGPLNCVPDLAAVAGECARLLRPGGALVFSVIGRLCPWEIAHYLRRRQWQRVRLRFARGFVPVSMNLRTIWTHYYWPRELYRAFSPQFALGHFRALCLSVPPPYLGWMRERHPSWHDRLWRMDRAIAGWPLLRNIGDHFLIVMTRR